MWHLDKTSVSSVDSDTERPFFFPAIKRNGQEAFRAALVKLLAVVLK